MDPTDPAAADDDLVDFVEEDSGTDPESPVWTVLVADDDEDVHSATALSLRGIQVEGRALELLHAYSATEALDIVRQRDDIAVLLLDVVMETEDAGLQLVRQIREELERRALRIILRTGQPGYAPEIETIRRHDINDYRTKADFTQVRLFTSLTGAVRAFRQLRAMERSRRGLEVVLAATDTLGAYRDHGRYALDALRQIGALLGAPEADLVCVRAGSDDDPPQVVAATGRYEPWLHHPLSDLPFAAQRQTLADTLQQRRCSFQGELAVYLPSSSGRAMAAVLDVGRLEPTEQHLVEMFSAHMAVGLDNVLLYNRLTDLAYHDQLLQLPNRNRLIELLDAAVRRGEASTLALVDIDDFAGVNEAFGHLFGDELLRAVGQRLAAAAGLGVTVARLASDTFAVLGPESVVDATFVSAVFGPPFAAGDEMLRLSVTTGLVRLRDAAAPASGVNALKDAHIALKHAKDRFRGGAWTFSREMAVDAAERVRLLRGLREAFDQQRLFVAYQPQVDLNSGQAVGVEALIRWRTDDGRFVPPDRFVPLAEQSGLIVTIGEFVLRTACHQLRRIQALGRPDFRMSVNVSQIQFRTPGFAEQVQRALRDCEVDPRCIELEITESMAAENFEFMMGVLTDIKRTGVSVAIDDFGTGFSSLSVLRQLGADRLKIDRAFVNELGAGADTQGTIARMVIDLGRSLGMTVIAEGVETEAQRELLQALGCHEGQGYHFARPMPAEQLEAWLGQAGG